MLSQAEQKTKYAVGTIISVERAEKRADRGVFVISCHLIDQDDGIACFLWKRLGRDGNLLAGNGTNNLRGEDFLWLEEYADIERFDARLAKSLEAP